MKNLKKKALVSAIAGVFAFGAGFYAAPNTSLPSLTLMQAAEAAPQWEQGTIRAHMARRRASWHAVPPSWTHSATSPSR